MTPERERELRRLILKGLTEERQPPDLSHNPLVKRLCEQGETISKVEASEIVWLLVREGWVFLVPDFNNVWDLQDFEIHLSDRGKRFIEGFDEYQPDDPDGYLALLEERCSDVDSLVKTYLREAVIAYGADCLLASTVMLGCASEQAIGSLGEVFITSNVEHLNQKFVNQFRSSRTRFSDKLADLRNQIVPMKRELPEALSGRFEHAMQVMAEFIRHTRNDAGHPSGIRLSPDQVRINLTTAGFYFEIVEGLRAHFSTLLESRQAR